MSGAILPFPRVRKKNVQYMWCWIVGCLVGFEGSGRKRYDLILSHCCIACLEFPKKVKKIRGKECCLLILPVLKTTANGLTKYMEQRLC